MRSSDVEIVGEGGEVESRRERDGQDAMLCLNKRECGERAGRENDMREQLLDTGVFQVCTR